MSTYGQINVISERVIGTSSEGHCFTYRGIATHPITNQVVEVYFKIFDPVTESKGMYNELFAYYAGLNFNLPVAETFICGCRVSQLPGPLPSWIQQLDREAFCSGIASVNAKPISIRQLRSTPDLFVSDLLSCKNLPSLVAFDEVIMNRDRTIQNLIRTNCNQYALIDHEQIFGSPSWDVESLKNKADEVVGNGLATLIFESTDELLKARTKKIANDFKDINKLTVYDIPEELENLCNLPKGTTKFLVQFVNERINILPRLLHRHDIASQLFAD